MRCVLLLALFLLFAMTVPTSAGDSKPAARLSLSSPAFGHGERIPVKYTRDGNDISPPLDIHGDVPNAKCLVLVMDDPDAPRGTWVHWLLWNIPPDTRSIAEGIQPQASVCGRNSWGNSAYGGPSPPSGTHRYIFTVYALDTRLELGPGAGIEELKAALKDHILADATLMGTYSR